MMHLVHARAVATAAALAILVPCASGCPSESPPEEPDDDAGSSAASLTVGEGSLSGGGMKFDVGGGEATSGADDGGPKVGCKLVDVVIAVDNSSSMQEEIEALAGPVFDSFPQTLLDINNGLDDFQLGVIDACNAPPFLHDTGAGGGCNYSTGKNFMSSSSPALLTEYECVTQLTPDGYMGQADDCSGDNDDEQPANTAADAVNAPAAAGPNAGFVRDDAVLFIVAITDEDEQPVPQRSAQEIADRIIAAKGSIDNVVFLGIGGDSSCDGPYGSADEAAMLREVSNIFVAADRGVFWDLCQGDLEAAFQTALQVVDSACQDFTPVG
ncbi:MAG: hypothetical protein U0168_10305 [Nannocystaceae bacterium]